MVSTPSSLALGSGVAATVTQSLGLCKFDTYISSDSSLGIPPLVWTAKSRIFCTQGGYLACLHGACCLHSYIELDAPYISCSPVGHSDWNFCNSAILQFHMGSQKPLSSRLSDHTVFDIRYLKYIMMYWILCTASWIGSKPCRTTSRVSTGLVRGLRALADGQNGSRDRGPSPPLHLSGVAGP
ncbi:hypothetical protein F4813DRAFT_318297 [Daldinia decipiens]|uniref:uncharacterized protein n=1 Tax=Daldinia decipiens TaxID=326647 RepID=UPI0020C4C78D|nr:uncharacterized protein F4813DRAFT_318297 [Daldinia decipiens]KAI1660257.1 hypothetical protein F4813DRAFT_318297 [Daldinia decipiens]